MSTLFADVAVWSETGWSTTTWVIVGLLLAGAVVMAHSGVLLVGWMLAVEWHWAAIAGVGGLVALISAGVALSAPYQMMRHLPEYKIAAWLGVAILAVAAAVAVSGALAGYGQELLRRARLGGAAVLAAGALVGLVGDGLNRAASLIPTTVAALVVLGVAGAAALRSRSN